VPPERLAALVTELATGLAPWAALWLIETADDDELTVIFADARMVEMLEAAARSTSPRPPA
jgi:hypothetical protein